MPFAILGQAVDVTQDTAAVLRVVTNLTESRYCDYWGQCDNCGFRHERRVVDQGPSGPIPLSPEWTAPVESRGSPVASSMPMHVHIRVHQGSSGARADARANAPVQVESYLGSVIGRGQHRYQRHTASHRRRPGPGSGARPSQAPSRHAPRLLGREESGSVAITSSLSRAPG